MSLDPYRTPARLPPDPMLPRAPPAYDVLVVTVVAWALGLMRVVFALFRYEAPCREVDFAWLLVLLAPLVAWREIEAAGRR